MRLLITLLKHLVYVPFFRVKLRDIPYIVRIVTVHSNPGVVVHQRRQGLFGSPQPGGGHDVSNVDLHILIAVIETELAKGR